MPLEVFVKNTRAPIEHTFNCHEWCDSEWCWAKVLTEKSHAGTMKRLAMVRYSKSYIFHMFNYYYLTMLLYGLFQFYLIIYEHI